MTDKLGTILYVDDEPNNLQIFEAALRRHYKIITASSAMEAIEHLKNNQVDLIITDQRMPEMTGVQLLEAVSPEYPDVIRMILTGFSDVDAIVKAINKGSVFRYITKPWDEQELKQIIDMGIKIRKLELANKDLYNDLKVKIEKQKEMIDLFKKYVPTDIVEQIVKDASAPPVLENEFRIVSALFCDIRDFTTFSESRGSQEVVSILNKFFTSMSECVNKNNGYIYKFLGDAMLVIFGAPVSTLYNQRNAVYCALDMVETLKNFNETIGKEVGTEFKIGIGVATGGVLVGHIASESHLIYSVLGSVIYDSMTIEDHTKDTPNSIIISEQTYKTIANDVEVESLGELSVGEAQQPLYRVTGKKVKQ